MKRKRAAQQRGAGLGEAPGGMTEIDEHGVQPVETCEANDFAQQQRNISEALERVQRHGIAPHVNQRQECSLLVDNNAIEAADPSKMCTDPLTWACFVWQEQRRFGGIWVSNSSPNASHRDTDRNVGPIAGASAS